MAFAVIRQPQNAENAFVISNSIIMWMIMDFFKTFELAKPQNGKKGLMTSPIYFSKCVEIKPFPTSALDMPKSKSDNIYCSFIQILWSLFPSFVWWIFASFSFVRRKSGGLSGDNIQTHQKGGKLARKVSWIIFNFLYHIKFNFSVWC